MNRLVIYASIITAVIALFGAACGDDNKDDTTPTGTQPAATPAATEPISDATATAQPGIEPTNTPGPFAGARDPVEGTLGETTGVPPVPQLTDVRAAEHEGYDRIVFEFDHSSPSYRVEYVTDPTSCGSGEPVVVDGDVFLQVTLRNAQAHDDQGASTIDALSMAPNLPALLAARQSCDVEGVVTWVIGLSQELDFHVTPLTNLPRLAIDIAHPE